MIGRMVRPLHHGRGAGRSRSGGQKHSRAGSRRASFLVTVAPSVPHREVARRPVGSGRPSHDPIRLSGAGPSSVPTNDRRWRRTGGDEVDPTADRVVRNETNPPCGCRTAARRNRKLTNDRLRSARSTGLTKYLNALSALVSPGLGVGSRHAERDRSTPSEWSSLYSYRRVTTDFGIVAKGRGRSRRVRVRCRRRCRARPEGTDTNDVKSVRGITQFSRSGTSAAPKYRARGTTIDRHGYRRRRGPAPSEARGQSTYPRRRPVGAAVAHYRGFGEPSQPNLVGCPGSGSRYPTLETR